jgi:hypothetical protein
MFYIYGLAKDNTYEMHNSFDDKEDAKQELSDLRDGYDDYYVGYKMTSKFMGNTYTK